MNGLTTNKHQAARLFFLFACLLGAASLFGWFVGWLHG